MSYPADTESVLRAELKAAEESYYRACEDLEQTAAQPSPVLNARSGDALAREKSASRRAVWTAIARLIHFQRNGVVPDDLNMPHRVSPVPIGHAKTTVQK